ncbi:OLC1v1014317C4 [Oldenlandia corymbosa var. corymbosa]|uniref:OLC1v1014317C4 n=1 Tax=Oldenlandia corymbosa var. corymbosa TaxID=529605 RepID=A0AAV1E414_OLDCO|nr:OLC1v1014317C4 [Oldenlandia corymbosa var. corymbosa]
MPLFSTGKIPKDSIGIATTSFYLNPQGIRKVTHLAIISSSGNSASSSSSSSSSSSNKCSATSKKFLAERSLRSGKHCDGAFQVHGNETSKLYGKTKANEGSTKGPSMIMAAKHSIKRRPLWRKLIRSKKVRGIILLNIVSVVYASNILVVKETEAFMDPAAFSAVRFAVCAIPFIPFVFQARNDVQTRKAGLELGVWMSLGYLIEALGLITAEAGRASFLSLFTVIVVPLLQSILGTMVPTRTWFGVLMSVLGVGMLECGGTPPNVGDLLNFLSAIFFGIHTLRTEHISRTTEADQHLPLLGYEVCVVAFLSSLWCILGGSFDGLQDNDNVTWTLVWDWMVTFPWVPALYTGLFSTVLCLWAEVKLFTSVLHYSAQFRKLNLDIKRFP